MSRLALLVSLSLFAAACVRSTPDPLRQEPSERRHSNVDYAGARDGQRARAESPPSAAPAPGPAGRAYDSSAPRDFEAEERPGLGTEWGETRTSRVSSEAFEREGTTPFVTAALYYNDADGIRAMTHDGAFRRPTQTGLTVWNGAFDVRLLDSGGSALATYAVGGRSYVVGHDGERYTIQIENHSGSRVEAVATVDGLDVIDGQPGSYEKRGYLIEPWGRVEIDGFRRSLSQVAAFRFGAVRDSYAARKGNAQNVGVIGVAFFSEAGAGYPWFERERESERRKEADPFPGRFATPPR